MRDNRLDALIQVGGIPVPAIVDLRQCDADRSAADRPAAVAADLRKAYPHLQLDVIPARHLRRHDRGDDAGHRRHLDRRCRARQRSDLRHHPGAVAPSTRKVLDEQPLGRQTRVETATVGLPVPLHPGAERYYAEAEQKQQKETDQKAKDRPKPP